MPARKKSRRKKVETRRHDEAKRTNIPTAEYSSALEDDDRSPGLFPENPRNDSCFSALLVHRMEDPHQADLGVAIRISRPQPRRRE